MTILVSGLVSERPLQDRTALIALPAMLWIKVILIRKKKEEGGDV